MRTPSTEADYLAWHVDGIMKHHYGTESGAYYKQVFVAMLGSESAGKEFVDAADSEMPTEGQLLLELAHHLALAMKLDAVGKTADAFLEIIEAYKCLTPATAMLVYLKNVKPSTIEKARKSRHQVNEAVKNYAVGLYRAGRYASPHDASKKLRDEVRKKAVELGGGLSEDRAQKTIHAWLMKATEGEH